MQTRTTAEGRAEAKAAIEGFRRDLSEDEVLFALGAIAGAITGGWAAGSATRRALRAEGDAA